MDKIVEIIPDDLPEWAQDAIDRGQLFDEMLKRINRAENALALAKKHLEESEAPFYHGMKIINDYFYSTPPIKNED